LVLLALPLVAAPLAAAKFGDFGRRYAARSLFALEPEPATRVEVPNPEKESPGEFALGFYACPVVRFYGAPEAYAGGGGLSFDYRPASIFALSAGFSFWAGEVRYAPDTRFGHEPSRQTPIRILEFTLAPRFYAHVWRDGSIYGEVRLVYAIGDGPDPVLRTQSWGADHYFGVEMGRRPWFAFVEFGFGARVAFFRKNGGWLGTNESRGSEGGGMFELTRIGLRWYF
jgi:hypothetical protein